MEDSLYSEMLDVENHHWWFVARREIISTLIASLNLTWDVQTVTTWKCYQNMEV